MMKNKIDINKWKEFKIGDLFDIHPTKAYKMNNSSLLAEDGINWKAKEGKAEEFMEKVNELYNIEVDFADEYKLSIDDFDGLVVSMDNFKDIINFFE